MGFMGATRKTATRLLDAIDALPERCRKVYLLSRAGLSLPEIMGRLKLPSYHVAQVEFHRAKELLGDDFDRLDKQRAEELLRMMGVPLPGRKAKGEQTEERPAVVISHDEIPLVKVERPKAFLPEMLNDICSDTYAGSFSPLNTPIQRYHDESTMVSLGGYQVSLHTLSDFLRDVRQQLDIGEDKDLWVFDPQSNSCVFIPYDSRKSDTWLPHSDVDKGRLRHRVNFDNNDYVLLIIETDRSPSVVQLDDNRPQGLSRADRIAASLSKPPATEYGQLASDLAELNRDVREEIASRLEPALNAKIQAMPHDTSEEKRMVARWVNEELRRFNLAIRFEKDGEEYPATLVVQSEKYTPNGRFRLEYKTPDGKAQRALYEEHVPSLSLMEAPPRREPLRWAERTARQSGAAQRGE
jgi:hypothetical protein